MFILISPSKAMGLYQFNGKMTAPYFLLDAEKLVARYRKLSQKKWQENMKISSALAAKTKAQYENYPLLPLCPAIYAFIGVQYRFLNPLQTSEAEKMYIKRYIRILDPLYGYLRPTDGIRPHRLELTFMRSTFSLAAFWKPRLQFLEQEEVLDLTSHEFQPLTEDLPHRKRLLFCEVKNEKRRELASYVVKRLRGLLLRQMMTQNILYIEQVKKLTIDGFQFSKENSSADCWIFLKTKVTKKSK